MNKIGFVWDPFDQAFERGFQETVKYKNKYGDANATIDYKTLGGFKLGSWQSHQRNIFRKGKLDQERIRRLEKVGFIWNPFDQAFEQGFQETLKYKKQYGNANAPLRYKTPVGFNLGIWQGTQKGNFKDNKLDPQRIQRLEEIGFVWNPLDKAFELGFQETLQYKKRFGNANVPTRYKTLSGFNLGGWQQSQRTSFRRNKLGSEQILRLKEIGIIWNLLDSAFEQGFQETLKYKKQYGDANTPRSYKTVSGFKLGIWQGTLRQRFKKNKLDPQRIQRLEEIGFVWDPFDQLFEQGFQATLEYKKQFGDANAPQDCTLPGGFKLGIWQSNLRNKFKNSKLDPQRIQRLEDIGFVWNPQELVIKESFEKGFQETLEYKKQFGDANAPAKYKAPSGFKLGVWQSSHRNRFKNNKLVPERIQRLEGIGFVWNPLDQAFEQGFQETLQFKKQYGDANAPQSYKTSNGFRLGGWQNNQRQNFKNVKLEPQRIRRLEEIGFIWDLKQRKKKL